MKPNDNFAEKLKQLRNLRKISQTKLGELINASYGQIQHYETGRSFPPYDKLKKLAEVLNVPVGYFFGEYEIINGQLINLNEIDPPKYFDENLERLMELINKNDPNFLFEVLRYAEYLNNKRENDK